MLRDVLCSKLERPRAEKVAEKQRAKLITGEKQKKEKLLVIKERERKMDVST